MQFEQGNTARIIFMGPHNWPTLEVDVSAEVERQFEALFRVYSMGGRRVDSDHYYDYAEKERAILGFDWNDEFKRRYNAPCIPCLVLRVTA